MKRKKLIVIGIIIVFFIGNIIYSKEKSKEQVAELPNVNEELLLFFKSNVEFEDIITYSQGDINEDNRDDLVVIYKKDNSSNNMVVVINDKNNIYTTTPKPAPKENAKIEFKNIDNKGYMEVIISGSKNGNAGYGVYRLENNELIDLFGEGMESCC